MKRIIVPVVIGLVVLSMGSYLRSLLLFDGSEPIDVVRDRIDKDRIPVDQVDNDPNSPIKGMTSLMKASAEGRLDLVQLFVSKGADLDKVDTTFGYTPLMHAITNKQVVIAEWLIKVARSHVGIRSMEGLRCVHAVLEIGGEGQEEDRKKIMRLVMEKGGDVNSLTNARATPMHLAVQRGDWDWVKFLKQTYGPLLDLRIKDKDGRTPLELANYLSYQDIANELGGYTR